MDISTFKKINDTLTKTETQIENVKKVLKQQGKEINLYTQEMGSIYSSTTRFYIPRKYLETYLKELEEIRINILKKIEELTSIDHKELSGI